MSEQKKPEPLDELLDSLLSTYADAEPRPGMETRLLANLHDQALSSPSNPAWPWRWLAGGAAAMALVAALVAIYVSRIPPLPRLPGIAIAGVPVLAPAPAARKSAEPIKKKPARPAQQGLESARVAGIRQEVFPSRSPLSEQERLLLRYLAKTPPEEVAAHSHSDEPAEPSVPLGPQSQQLNEIEVRGVGYFR